MKSRNRRIKIEWMKARIAFVVMLISAASIDSENCIIPIVMTLLSIIYLKVVASRLEKRGAF